MLEARWAECGEHRATSETPYLCEAEALVRTRRVCAHEGQGRELSP